MSPVLKRKVRMAADQTMTFLLRGVSVVGGAVVDGSVVVVVVVVVVHTPLTTTFPGIRPSTLTHSAVA